VAYRPGSPSEVTKALAAPDIVEQLAKGDVVVVGGRANLAESEATAMSVLSAVLAAVPGAKLLPALRRGNVVGALQLGLAPTDGDHDALATLRRAADGSLDLLVLLGADPLDDCPDTDLARRALAGAGRIISIDTFPSASTRHADLVLPAAAFAEQSGTTTNLEGRVTRVTQKVTAHGTSRPDWMIAAELAALLGHDIGFASPEAGTALIARTVPAFAAASPAALDEHPAGVLTAAATGALPAASSADAPPNGYDYRLVVSRKLYDQAVNTAMSPSLAPLAIGAGAHLHPADFDKVGLAEGTEVTLTSTKGSVVLPLHPNAIVARGTVWAPFNQPGATVNELVDASAPVTDVRIERLS
jgi:NADH-quinone oxidoreductase subunit G